MTISTRVSPYFVDRLLGLPNLEDRDKLFIRSIKRAQRQFPNLTEPKAKIFWEIYDKYFLDEPDMVNTNSIQDEYNIPKQTQTKRTWKKGVK